MDKVTVDKAYFDALLRRADFHTTAHGRTDPTNISISKLEYESLQRQSHEYDALKAALTQGGVTIETLELLVGHVHHDERKDSATDLWTTSGAKQPDLSRRPSFRSNSVPEVPYMTTGGYSQNRNQPTRPDAYQRKWSYPHAGTPPMDDDDEENLSMDGDAVPLDDVSNAQHDGKVQDHRTLYFAGLSERSTYKDLLAVVKGGQLLSVLMRGSGATVSFYSGASDFLAWSKRNDIYIQNKRIEVRWAERQFRLNSHIATKIMTNNASRNLLIRSAADKGHTESSIRADMDHIHNLIIISITFRGPDAHVSTNSVHNSLYARTCMMSRVAYRGCRIEFVVDECDVPLPVHVKRVEPVRKETGKGKVMMANRFGLLNMDGTEADSDEENRAPSSDGTE
ncbi:hypothetical protein B0A48_04113 [Cryoendolithus antarcticus]|uniref:RRM domain-containing protein n=1 Tax=Cryoendolithus antarcticus TaxID=1507870 RepID=A0A1V8THF0_9PEZI|nr:hypothetical protein B0A48_04113 [Cryoendolithus antarcticus]